MTGALLLAALWLLCGVVAAPLAILAVRRARREIREEDEAEQD